MANTAWRNSKAICPYYRRSNALCITCAQSEKETRELRHKMATKNDCSMWFGMYCSGKYAQCIYYEIIRDKTITEEYCGDL